MTTSTGEGAGGQDEDVPSEDEGGVPHHAEVRIGNRRLAPGDVAPDFALPGADGRTVKSATYRGGRTVLFFYPAAGTPGCTVEARDFQTASGELADAGYAVVGVSPDEIYALRRFCEAEGIGFPLLSDPTHAVLEAYGAWGDTHRGDVSTTGVIRSTVVVDGGGRVISAEYGVEPRGHVATLLDRLRGDGPQGDG